VDEDAIDGGGTPSKQGLQASKGCKLQAKSYKRT